MEGFILNYKMFYNLKAVSKFSVFTLALLFLFQVNVNAQGGSVSSPVVPAGFTDDLISSGWKDLRQVTFDSLGRMFVVEGAGEVWIVDTNGIKIPSPLLNIKEEVGQWSSHGLTGLALDKDFLTNGYFYVMYTVDRHYLMKFGTTQYNANANEYFNATINRVTRFQADQSTNFTTLIPGSRFVLLGQDKKTGIPVTYTFHDGGHVEMSPDGSLLISTGDNAHGGAVDTGSNAQTYYAQCLIDTILTPETNVGAFRSQLTQSLNGKILRIDPMTGLGLSSNPYYDPAHPESPISKVWCLGLRQPYQFKVKPGTAQNNDVTAGKPGTLYIGDVGFYKWESLFVSAINSENFGWPKFEGMAYHNGFVTKQTPNRFAPNPLFGSGGCNQEFFNFNNLLIDPTLDPNPSWPNTCDSAVQIPSTLYRYVRTRPVLAFFHADSTTYVPTWNGFNPTLANVGAVGSPATGIELKSQCISGLEWYTGNKFPALFKNQMFITEYDTGYMCRISLDSLNNVLSVDTFAHGLGDCLGVVYNVKEEALYYIEYPYEIHRIRYTLGVNVAPTAHITQDVKYGPGPLTVNFSGLSSTDPENAPLSYFWDFGDGNTSTNATPTHVFSPSTGSPFKYDVHLTVTDSGGLTQTAAAIVSVNNTPPSVQITSPVDGTWYSAIVDETHNLTANVTDLEHTANQLHYAWYVSLHHNTHEHPNPIDTDKVSYFISSPEDSLETYYYEITLTVTDDAGLSSVQSSYIYQGNAPIVDLTADKQTICLYDTVQFNAVIIGKADSLKWIFQNGTPATSKLTNPKVIYNNGFGSEDVKLIAYCLYGNDTVFYNAYIKVKSTPNPNQNITGNVVSCIDDSVALTTTYNSNYTYQWLQNGLPVNGATTTNFTANNTGVYNVWIAQPNGCSSKSTPLNYVEHVINPQLNQTGNIVLCNQDSIVLIADTSAAYNYDWFMNNVQLPNETSYSLTAGKTGFYYAVISDTNTCIKTTDTVTITKTPEAETVFLTDSIICPATDTVLISANSGSGLNYQWYKDGLLLPGATNITYAATVAGLYSVKVADLAGCSHMSEVAVVTSCVGLNTILNDNKFQIYPNPFMNLLYVSFNNTIEKSVAISITDATGRLLTLKTVNTTTGINTITIPTSSLPKGVYQLTVKGLKINYSKRIIKS